MHIYIYIHSIQYSHHGVHTEHRDFKNKVIKMEMILENPYLLQDDYISTHYSMYYLRDLRKNTCFYGFHHGLVGPMALTWSIHWDMTPITLDIQIYITCIHTYVYIIFIHIHIHMELELHHSSAILRGLEKGP